jgi:hypothetical protein
VEVQTGPAASTTGLAKHSLCFVEPQIPTYADEPFGSGRSSEKRRWRAPLLGGEIAGREPPQVVHRCLDCARGQEQETSCQACAKPEMNARLVLPISNWDRGHV